MIKPVWVTLILCALLLTCCQQPNPTPTVVPTPTLAPVTAPAHETAAAFLDAWAIAHYEAMYALCSRDARAATPYDEFVRIYQEVAEEATILTLQPTLQAVLQEGWQARAAFHLAVETGFVGDFTVENELPLIWEGDRWAVEWSKRCILAELEGDNLVHMVSRSPVRANIYDALGKGLAVKKDLVTVGVVPGDIEDETALLSKLAVVLQIPQSEIKAEYEGQPQTWFIPIADISAEQSQEHY